jgi:crotonobetaine/carnitine-CoA ligase
MFTADPAGRHGAFLLKAPPTPRDRDHTLRKVVMIPLLEESLEFAERFGVDVYPTFNMTETSWPIFSEPNPRAPRTSGRTRPGVEARIVDEHDLEVGDGEVGELILRTDTPWTMAVGYLNDPAATAQAWRNGWFHTGDAFRRDAGGDYFFVDRTKNSIRRRGENVSSYQVESDIFLHPAVHEAAVVGVSSDVGESDVLAFVVLKPGHTLTPADLIDFLVPRMPYFTVPRYLHFVDELPRTPTQKVRKTVLREQGSASAWDREAAGFTLSRRGGANRATGSPPARGS